MRSLTAAVVAVVLAVLCPTRADAQSTNPAPGEDFHVELGAMFWTPTPRLLIGTDRLAALGIGPLDFAETFELDDSRFTEFRAVLRPARKHKLRVSYVPFRYDAEARISRTIQFGGLTVPIDAAATADIRWDLWRFGYEWDVVARDRGFLGVIGEVKYNRMTVDLAAPPFGAAISDTLAPIPTFGVIGRVYPHRLFSITGEWSGLSLPDDWIEAIDGSVTDLDIYGTLSLGRMLGIQGGYRLVQVDYVVDDDTGDLEMKGFYVGGVLRF